MTRRLLAVLLLLLVIGPGAAQEEKGRVVVASKLFTESRILAEILAQLIESETDITVERQLGLGGTMVCFTSLREGEIDLYPEYTGTGLVTILGRPAVSDPLRAYLEVSKAFEKQYGLTWLKPYGFNNSYALAMPLELAQEWKVSTISDLERHQDKIRAGFTHEFLERPDGWPGLVKAYDLSFDARGMDHGLAYEAVSSGAINLIDAYTTDGKLLKFKLRALEDDKKFFPPYHAATLIRRDTLERYPELEPLLNRLTYQLPDARMQELNYLVEEEGMTFAAAAHRFLQGEGLTAAPAPSVASSRSGVVEQIFTPRMLGLLGQHLKLVVIAVLAACLVGIPLGIWISTRPGLAPPVLGTTGVVQTIPSLALLAFMIPLLGLGPPAAITALFLYALLPIVRNTYTGILEVDANLIEAARGMGLTGRQILTRVQLPLATRTIMAGVRTSTVITVGVATLAAFIGAGGLGDPIITGLQLNDLGMILSGAVPAGLLALAVDFTLGKLEELLAPRGT